MGTCYAVNSFDGWHNFRVLMVETHYFRRLTAEAWFINSYPMF